MKKKNSNNGKNNIAKNRGKSRADLSRRKSYGINRNFKPQKNSAHRREAVNKMPETKGFSFKNTGQPKAGSIVKTAPNGGNSENCKADTVETVVDAAAEKPTAGRSPFISSRWYNNPRITGAVAAVLLFATLAIAIIPTSSSVRAEEQSELAALDPTMQLAKEYIYAGSRMLAIEDYGLNTAPSPTSTATPSPSVTPTPDPMLQVTDLIAQEINGVYWMSETDRLISTVTYEGDPLQILANEYPGMTISEADYSDFYDRYGTKNESLDERERKISQAINIIDGSSNQVKVLRVGQIDMPLIIIGEWSTGRWFGMKTSVVETGED